MSSKKIAILGSRGIPAQYGGFETFAEKISVLLALQGHDVTVYAESENGITGNPHFGDVKITYIKKPFRGGVGVLLYDVLSIIDARNKFDVVYMLGYGAAWICWLPKLYGARGWINLDGLEWARSKWKRPVKAYLKAMEKVAGWAASLLVADSQAIKADYIYRNGRVPCVFIPYGADLVEVSPEKEQEWINQWHFPPYILVVARMEPENHVLEIVSAFSRYKGSCKLVVVGGLDDTNHYHQHIRETADPSNTVLMGPVYDKEALHVLRTHARLYIHGHSVGGTNPSLLEAMAAGNLILAHDNVFNREVLGDAGFYFSGLDDILESVERAEKLSEEQRKHFSEAVVSKIQSCYSWKEIASRYDQLLRGVVSE